MDVVEDLMDEEEEDHLPQVSIQPQQVVQIQPVVPAMQQHLVPVQQVNDHSHKRKSDNVDSGSKKLKVVQKYYMKDQVTKTDIDISSKLQDIAKELNRKSKLENNFHLYFLQKQNYYIFLS